MKKKNLLFLGSSVFCLAVSVFTLNSIKNIDVSYSIPTDTNGVPTSDFTTNSNFANPQKINLVGAALGSTSYSAGVKNSFEMVKNLKDRDNTYPLYVLSKNKYTPSTNETFAVGGGSNNPIDVTDAGLKKIIKYGYNNLDNPKTVFNRQNFVTNYGTVSSDTDKQYITQLAIWLYIYKNSGNFSSSYCANNGCQFYDNSDESNPALIPYNTVIEVFNTAKSQNRNLGYVTELLNLAEGTESSAAAFNYSDDLKNYTFDDSKKYILSGPFKLTNINDSKFISWSVEVLDRSSYGLEITDNDGNKLNNLNNLSKDQIIRIKIPVNGTLEQMSNRDYRASGIKVSVNTFVETNSFPIVKDYRVTETSNGDILLGEGGTKVERFSNVMLGIIKTNPSEDLFYLKNFSLVSKVDAATGEEIGGARLAIYRESDMNSDFTASINEDNYITSWTSVAGETHKFFIEDGTYGLCETLAPDGYGRINEEGEQTPSCIKFVVMNEKVSATHMDNYRIPNTGLFKSKISYTIGGVLIIAGIMGMVIVLGNGKKKKSQQEQTL